MKSWKANLAACAAATFFCIIGWSLALPFMPLYIRELGVTDLHQVELWSGLLASATPIAAVFSMPLWGALADRKGHKRNTERAGFTIAITFILMAFAGSVQQMFAARIAQGLMAGFMPAMFGLISTFVPTASVGYALGLILMSTNAGAAVGPLLGGFVADLVGYRWAFALSGACNALSGFVVLWLVREQAKQPAAATSRNNGIAAGARTVAHSPVVFGAILIMAGAMMADTLGRVILPLFVETLQSDPARVNTATGLVLFSIALAAALSSVFAGRLADRAGNRPILLACAGGAVISYAGQALAPNFGLFMAASILLGLSVGGLIPTANSILARRVNREQQGAVYGLSASANSAGNMLGPLIGAAAATGLGMRYTFAGAGVIFLVLVVIIATTIGAHHREEKA